MRGVEFFFTHGTRNVGAMGGNGMSTQVFPEMGVPKNRWFIRESPIKMADLGVPRFQETPIYNYIYIYRLYIYGEWGMGCIMTRATTIFQVAPQL